MNMAYEIATFRRPSMMMKAPDVEEGKENESPSQLTPPLSQDTPVTPMPPDVDDIDDEFNLPISLAFFLLLAYILCGAGVYTIWEDWDFFESCYFVFISMYCLSIYCKCLLSEKYLFFTGPPLVSGITFRNIRLIW